MIHTTQVSFRYRDSEVLQFPDIRMQRGEHCLLLGNSGSGKTTLLHLLGGLLRDYNGSIRVMEKELADLSGARLDHFRGTHMGFIFQRHHLIKALSVTQNLKLVSFLSGVAVPADRINEILSRLGLEEKRGSRISSLSQGQAQRVAIARAVLHHPSLILADEPTSSLDDDHCTQVMNLLMDVVDEQKATLLIATHDHRLKEWIGKTVMLESQKSAAHE